MLPEADCRLLPDPHMPWPAGCPYALLDERLRRLGHAGLGPSSTALEVQDALYALMSREDREILDEVRYLDRRLGIDFFMYRFAGELSELLEEGLWERPIPITLPDFAALAPTPGRLAATVELPGAFDPGPRPEPVEPPDALPPLDIGPIESTRRALETDHVG